MGDGAFMFAHSCNEVFEKGLPNSIEQNETFENSEKSWDGRSAKRRCTIYRRCYPINDSLDLALQSTYDHTQNAFPDKVDPVLQKETLLVKRPEEEIQETERFGHPLKIIQIAGKIHPSKAQIMPSGHHTQLTNPGYSRQPADGNFFKY